MNTLNTKSSITLFISVYFLLIGFTISAQPPPMVTIRFANPEYHFTEHQYCVNVEFLADVPNIQVFGVNVRFFYDESILALAGFSDFSDGYDAVAPNPPEMFTSAAGPVLFNFAGPAVYVSGAIQLVNQAANPIILDPVVWKGLFKVCFDIVDPNADAQNFCPSLVWDLEQDPENGGFLVGDDGVVITCLDPDPLIETQMSVENVVQFNWAYTGSGGYPLGVPVSNQCISLGSPLVITPPQNVSIEFGESTDPSHTGFATAVDLCGGNPFISYTDVDIPGHCTGSFEISRRWIAVNDCNAADTSFQNISISDTTVPVLTEVPKDIKIMCGPLPVEHGIIANDLSTPISIEYSETISEGSEPGEFLVVRQWICTDGCGNSSVAIQNIYWMPGAVTSSEIILPAYMECNSDKVNITSVVTGELEGVTYYWEVSGEKSFIQDGQGAPEIYIHVGSSVTTVTLTVTDQNGCNTVRSVQFDCNYSGDPEKLKFRRMTEINEPESKPGQGLIQAAFKDEPQVQGMTLVNVWPNPSDESVYLGFESNDQQKIQISIINALGQAERNDLIRVDKGYTMHEIDISMMTEGKYLIWVKSGEVTYSKNIVILHRE